MTRAEKEVALELRVLTASKIRPAAQPYGRKKKGRKWLALTIYGDSALRGGYFLFQDPMHVWTADFARDAVQHLGESGLETVTGRWSRFPRDEVNGLGRGRRDVVALFFSADTAGFTGRRGVLLHRRRRPERRATAFLHVVRRVPVLVECGQGLVCGDPPAFAGQVDFGREGDRRWRRGDDFFKVSCDPPVLR